LINELINELINLWPAYSTFVFPTALELMIKLKIDAYRTANGTQLIDDCFYYLKQ